MHQVSIEKSIERILKTPIGSRVMRPDFGSNLFELIDKRADDKWKIDCIRYTYEAIDKWEKRVRIDKVIPEKIGETTSLQIAVTDIAQNIQKEITISM
jgi:uncharacterized protein